MSSSISEMNAYALMKAEMNRMFQKGIKSFEWHIRSGTNHQLSVYGMDGGRKTHPIVLDYLLGILASESCNVQILLNLQEPHLEKLGLYYAKKWALLPQISFTGSINPASFTLHQRQHLHYPVEQCLPNYYQLEKIKDSHLDVIHYFMRQQRVKTLRMHKQGLNEAVLHWSLEHEIKLSIYGAKTLKAAAALTAKGIDFVFL